MKSKSFLTLLAILLLTSGCFFNNDDNEVIDEALSSDFEMEVNAHLSVKYGGKYDDFDVHVSKYKYDGDEPDEMEVVVTYYDDSHHTYNITVKRDGNSSQLIDDFCYRHNFSDISNIIDDNLELYLASRDYRFKFLPTSVYSSSDCSFETFLSIVDFNIPIIIPVSKYYEGLETDLFDAFSGKLINANVTLFVLDDELFKYERYIDMEKLSVAGQLDIGVVEKQFNFIIKGEL